jgi:DNA polymerase-1
MQHLIVDNIYKFDEMFLKLNPAHQLYIDFEGTPKEPTILSISSDDIDIIYVIEYPEIYKDRIKELCWGKCLVAFSSTFEYLCMKTLGIKHWLWKDPMLIYLVVNAGLINKKGTEDLADHKSLAAVCKRMLGIEVDKSLQKSFIDELGYAVYGPYSEEQLEYAASDVHYIKLLLPLLELEVEAKELQAVINLEHRVMPVFAEMSSNRIMIDAEGWRRFLTKEEIILREKQEKLQRKLNPWYQEHLRKSDRKQDTKKLQKGELINLASPDQLKKTFLEMGYELENTAELTLKEKSGKYPLLKELLEFRLHNSLLTKFGEKWIEKYDPLGTRAVSPQFDQLGAYATGRSSARSPNIQQIPVRIFKILRSFFVAKEGHKFIISDFSGQELRILAELSQDIYMVESFQKGEDLHNATAIRMVGEEYNNNPKESRKLGKTLNFQIFYGGGIRKLAVALGIPRWKAKKLLEEFHAIYYVASQWLQDQEEICYSRGYSQTILGRKRFLPEIKADTDIGLIFQLKRFLKNAIIQGTAADMSKLAMVWIAERFEVLGMASRIAMFIHDEIVVDSPDGEVEQAQKIVKDAMIRAGQFFLKTIPIEVELRIEQTWAKPSEDDKPEIEEEEG